MRSSILAFVFALFTLAAPQVATAQTFTFAFEGPTGASGPLSGSGFFFTGPDQGGFFNVNNVTGTVTTSQGTFGITGISSYAGADNVLNFPVQPYVTFSGISFSTLLGGDFNIFSNPAYFGISSSVSGDPTGFPQSGTALTTFTVAAVPVPAPVAGAGIPVLLGLGAAWFARRRKQKLAA